MSYTSQQFLVCDNSSNANFRSWGSAISAAILAMGWVQTSDTGQVNWTTVTVPAANTYAYEIWKPADAFQTGATQYFLKLEYGNSNGANAPAIRVSLATSTNGSGTLTGSVTSVFGSNEGTGTGGGATTPYECNFSGDIDRMGVMLWRNI